MILIENNIMTEFEYFLKENNYEDDLEFKLCDLEMAFNAGKELHWKPSEADILLLERIANGKSNPRNFQASLCGLIEQLKKLKE